MALSLGTGILMLLAGAVFLLSAAVRRAAVFEYAWAMFFGEWGLMLLAGQVIPAGRVQLLVSMTLVASMLATAALWWKLFRGRSHTANKETPA